MAEKYKDYVVVSVKMPRELRDKIKRLAVASQVTFNGWALKRLAREARWGQDKKR